MSVPGDDASLHAKAAALEGEFIQAGEGEQAGANGTAGPAPPGPSTGKVISALLRPTFDLLAPAWNVSDTECENLGDAYGTVLDKYFPDFDLGPEVAALFVTFAVFGPRMRTPRHNPKPDTRADAAAPQQG